MSLARSMLLAALVAASAGFAAAQPAAAGTTTSYADLTVQVRHGDRDRYDRRYRHWDHRWRKHRRCYTDVDYRWRYGYRVRVIERICFDRKGRRYVADRRIVRIGFRY